RTGGAKGPGNRTVGRKVNYPPTAKPMGWASGVADSPIGNASSRFCLESDCIPQPDNKFIPCFNIFFAAFISLSWASPQDSQVHSLMESVRSCFIHPQLEQVLLLGKNLSILTNCLSFHLALYSSMVYNAPNETSPIAWAKQ